MDALLEDPPRIDRETRRFSTFEAACARFPGTSERLKFIFDQPRYEQRTPEWFRARHHAITASDFATAACTNPFSTQFQLYMKKIGQGTAFDGNEYTRWGNHFEDAAAYLYEKRYRKTILDFGLLSHHKLFEKRPKHIPIPDWIEIVHGDKEPPETVAVPPELFDLTWLKGSPDGITTDGILVEIKCPGLGRTKIKHRNTVPTHYMGQLQCLMELLDLNMAHFIQYVPKTSHVPDGDFVVIEVPRDSAYFTVSKNRARELWQSVVRHRATREATPLIQKYLTKKRSHDDDDESDERKRLCEMDELDKCMSEVGFCSKLESVTTHVAPSNFQRSDSSGENAWTLPYALYVNAKREAGIEPLSEADYNLSMGIIDIP